MNLSYELFVQLAPVVATSALAVFGFLLNSYFARIRESNEEVKSAIAKSEGKSEALQMELRANTIELVKLRSEVSALWRFVDNTYKRASDHRGDNGIDIG